MSLSLLIRARTCSNLLYHLPKQINLGTCSSSTSTKSLLAQSTKIISSVSYATAAKAADTQSDNTKWITIYNLPMIRLAAGFQRLKIYQGAITGLALPISIGLAEMDLVSNTAAVVIGAIGGTGLITLALCGLIGRNLVGFIYINEECDKLKLAYIDYWGKRRHAIVDIDDLDFDWEKARPTAFNLYQKIRLHSDKKQAFKLLFNYGVIVEPETFAGIFGE